MSFTDFFTGSASMSASAPNTGFISNIEDIFTPKPAGCRWEEPRSYWHGYYYPYTEVRTHTHHIHTRERVSRRSVPRTGDAGVSDTPATPATGPGLWASIGNAVLGSAMTLVSIGVGIVAAPVLGVGAAVGITAGLLAVGATALWGITKVVRTEGNSAIIVDAGASTLKILAIIIMESMVVALGLGLSAAVAPALGVLATVATLYVVIELIAGLVIWFTAATDYTE